MHTGTLRAQAESRNIPMGMSCSTQNKKGTLSGALFVLSSELTAYGVVIEAVVVVFWPGS